MLNSGNVTKQVLRTVNPLQEGSHQVVGSTGQAGANYYEEESQDENIIPDSPERDLVVYHLVRMVRDLYINSKEGGKEKAEVELQAAVEANLKGEKKKPSGAAYRKQCRTKRKNALAAILSLDEGVFGFRWVCASLGYDANQFRNRILFDVEAVTSLLRDGVRATAVREKTVSRKTLTSAQAWLWEDAPLRFQLSEKKGHFIIKISQLDAATWIESLKNSPMDFSVEQFDLTSGDTILIVRHK